MGWSEWDMGLLSGPLYDGSRQDPQPRLKVTLPTFEQTREAIDTGIMKVMDQHRENIQEAEADLIRAAVQRGFETGRGVMVAHGIYQFEDGPDSCKVSVRVAAWPSSEVPVGEIRSVGGIIDWLVVEGLIEESRGD